MDYVWERSGKVWQLEKLRAVKFEPNPYFRWGAGPPLGRIRRVKNKNSCKKFIVDRYLPTGGWQYITLLAMKLDEAKDVARVLLIAGSE
jgi:hypothetical protein